ncbi:MAG: transglycosylase SLT domain-containing protein [Pseudomonadota bacterium]
MIKRIITMTFLGFATLSFPIKANPLPKIKRANTNDNDSLAHSTDCSEIISQIETEYNIPKNLLAAVAMVESGQKPYAVHSCGRAFYFKSHADAVKYVTDQVQKGENLYLGTMQICFKSHRKELKSIEHALNPYNNIRFAGKLLKSLYKKHGTWFDAVKYYNASTRRVAYTKRVMAIWGGRDKLESLANLQAANKKIRVAFGPGVGIHSK